MFLVTALVLAACGGTNTLQTAASGASIATNLVSSGKSLPSVSLDSVDGTKVGTNSLLGRPLLINFWYSTCEPCRREMPALDAAHGRHGERVDFIGVNMYDSAVAASNFAQRYGITFPVLLDSRGELVAALGIALAPTTILVDASGTIVHQASGELSEEEIDDLIAMWFPK